VNPEDRKKVEEIADKEKMKYLSQNNKEQNNKKGGNYRMKQNKTRKVRGGEYRIGIMNPTYGGACPCITVPKIPMALGGYRATKRNLKYLKLWKKGKSIGFTMRSSLKAKGLIPRANGKKQISVKYS